MKSLRISPRSRTCASFREIRDSGKLEDVFDIQEQISRKIVDALKMKLSSQEERKLSERSGFTNYPFLAKYDKTLARFHGDARFD
jgi:hypothetical protein